MKLLPPGRSDLLAFVAAHLPAWQADPAAVGLTAPQLAALQTLLDEAAEAFARARQMHDAARAATLDSNTRLTALRTSTAAALGMIKAFAGTQGISGGDAAETAVYADAQIAVPLSPAPLPGPDAVRSLSIAADSTGRATLTWKPPHPRDARERAASTAGLLYAVQRKRPGERASTIPFLTAKPRFTDEPLAAGTTVYMVRAMRGDTPGPWSAAISIESGMGGIGGIGKMGAESAASLKMAA